MVRGAHLLTCPFSVAAAATAPAAAAAPYSAYISALGAVGKAPCRIFVSDAQLNAHCRRRVACCFAELATLRGLQSVASAVQRSGTRHMA